MLLGPAEIRDLAQLLGVQPTKKLGQNFVVDANTVRKIVASAHVKTGDRVIEVGPGLGSLTLGLLEVGADVLAIEIDKRLAEQLPRTVAEMAPGVALGDGAPDSVSGDVTAVASDPVSDGVPTEASRLVSGAAADAEPSGVSGGAAGAESGGVSGGVVDTEPAARSEASAGAALTVLAADAMRVRDLSGNPTRLVANLPYNVSVPVLLHLMQTVPSLSAGVVMVQAEVGYRLAADPGSKVYGSPSVKAAWYGSWRTAGTVSRQVFWPVPNVDSVLVEFARHDEPFGTEAERERTFALVDAAFAQRRKMLRQSLGSVLGSSADASEVLERAGVAPTGRGETLTVHDFLRIARAAL
ncbi:rRNA adenine dimethyltransferase family protein [Microbacterium sp. MPKO10]|uniref:ribosomal RNA small subunit methyltransferase A n=1 Tax=Microbacterium sp. MPKO10 TaxID=2989818 RepID=UPI0035560531